MGGITWRKMMSDVYNPQCPSYQNEVYSDTSESVASSDDFKNTGTTVVPTINFNLGDEVVLVVDKNGLTYRGKLAADAGECYVMLTHFLNRAKREKL